MYRNKGRDQRIEIATVDDENRVAGHLSTKMDTAIENDGGVLHAGTRGKLQLGAVSDGVDAEVSKRLEIDGECVQTCIGVNDRSVESAAASGLKSDLSGGLEVLSVCESESLYVEVLPVNVEGERLRIQVVRDSALERADVAGECRIAELNLVGGEIDR